MRVVFYPFLNNLGHVVPSLEMAEALRSRGHEVGFRGEGIFGGVVTEAGFRLDPVFTFSDEYDRRHEAWMGQWTDAVVERAIGSELDALDEDAPDVAVSDYRPTLGVSARVLGIPQVSVLCSDWTNHFRYPAAALDLDRHFGRKWGRRLGRSVVPPVRAWVLQRAARALRRAYRRFGVPLAGRGNLFDAWTGDLNLLTDMPELAPLAPTAPESFRFVGPPLRGVGSGSTGALERIDPDRPLIYVTLGSSGIRPGEPSVHYVAEALGGRREQVFMTTGGQCRIPDGLPDNLIVTEVEDGMALCRRADLVICKGGTGTVYQAIGAGTPLLCIPRNHNQFYVSERIERAGAGRMAPDGIGQEEFVRLVDASLGDETAPRRVRELQRSLLALRSERRAERLIEALAPGSAPATAAGPPAAARRVPEPGWSSSPR